MKCDELEARTIYVDCLGRTIVYFDPYEVNDAIKELKQKLQDQCISCPVKMQEDAAIAELKQKLEDAKASAYAESVDAGMENRRLKRALWLARGYIMTLLQRDFQRLAYQCNNGDYKKNLLNRRNRYYDLYEKCRAKAEEYK